MGATYRETALEQAVISHGKVQVPMSAPHTNYEHPNDPAQVVQAATAYERFLDRSSRELEDLVDLLAERLGDAADALATMVAAVSPPADPGELPIAITDALRQYRAWKAMRAEPF